MPSVTTALLTAGPKLLAPWGDRSHRFALTAQLVESPAYWLVTPTQPAEHPVAPESISIEIPEPESVVESILMLLSSHLGGRSVEGYLTDTANISIVDGVRVIAPYFDVSADDTFRFLADNLKATLRLTVTRLDEFTLMNDEVIDRLRSIGFDVDVFGLVSSGVDASK